MDPMIPYCSRCHHGGLELLVRCIDHNTAVGYVRCDTEVTQMNIGKHTTGHSHSYEEQHQYICLKCLYKQMHLEVLNAAEGVK